MPATTAQSIKCTSRVLRNTTTGFLTLAAVAIGALTLQASGAKAVSEEVKNACVGDYLAYCSAYEVGSSKLRKCMRSVGPKLSSGCVTALINAGEVGRPTKTKMSRRTANLR